VDAERLDGVGFGLQRRRAGLHPFRTHCVSTRCYSHRFGGAGADRQYEQMISTLSVYLASSGCFGGQEMVGRLTASVVGRFGGTLPASARSFRRSVLRLRALDDGNLAVGRVSEELRNAESGA
jgi:hypothetical protein